MNIRHVPPGGGESPCHYRRALEIVPTLGMTPIEPLRALHQWTEAHYDAVLRAREAYDDEGLRSPD